jgi:hypothetical protein
MRPAAERFWSRVDKNGPTVREEIGPCWMWKGSCNPRGYGAIISSEHNEKLAHRLSYVLNVGPIPEGLRVLHSCDNPPCVNPAHLRVGTQADNARDREIRSRVGNTRMTAELVLEMRRRYKAGENAPALAKAFGISEPSAYQIVRGDVWRNVEGGDRRQCAHRGLNRGRRPDQCSNMAAGGSPYCTKHGRIHARAAS